MNLTKKLVVLGAAAFVLPIAFLGLGPREVLIPKTRIDSAREPNVHVVYTALEDCRGNCGDPPKVRVIYPIGLDFSEWKSEHYFSGISEGTIYDQKWTLRWQNYEITTNASRPVGWNTKLSVCHIDADGKDFDCQVDEEGCCSHTIELTVGPAWIGWIKWPSISLILLATAAIGVVLLVAAAFLAIRGRLRPAVASQSPETSVSELK